MRRHNWKWYGRAAQPDLLKFARILLEKWPHNALWNHPTAIEDAAIECDLLTSVDIDTPFAHYRKHPILEEKP